MNNKTSNDNDIQERHSGKKGVDGIPLAFEYEKLWDKLKEDIGLSNIILIFLGSILLIFSPENGWEFDIPFINYSLAYRGWLGIFCFVIALISIFINKKKNMIIKNENKRNNTIQISSEPDTTSSKTVNSDNKETEETLATFTKRGNFEHLEINAGIKSMYVHFSKDKINNLSLMCTQLYMCKNFDTAIFVLINFYKIFKGKLYLSPFIQTYAKEKLATIKGENDKEWCWWYWDGGEEGFQVIISLCK
jgi:hypothetical protein